MTGRWVFCPMTSKRLCRRITLMERIRRRFRKVERPDLYMVCNFNQPIFPGK